MSNYPSNYHAHDYNTLTAWIDGGRGIDRALANNTRAVRGVDEDGAQYAAIRYHRTEVVRFYEDGRTMFDSGGWRTVTTKERMNYARRFSVWQTKGKWYVEHKHKGARTHVLTDGIMFTKRGRAMNALDPQTAERKARADEKLRKKIRAYATDAAYDLWNKPRPANEMGDCFYCHMTVVSTGENLGDASKSDHLEHHLEEGYCPTSLYINAMKETKQREAGVAYDLGAEETDGEWLIGGSRSSPERVAEAIYRYIVRRLLPDHVTQGGTRPVGTQHEEGTFTGYW